MMPLYKHGDRLFQIKREIPLHNFQRKGTNHLDMEYVKAWRDWLGAEHVLRTQTHFLFVMRVDDVEFEEVINEEVECV
tara:strand:+ start:48 stop:281 length:234 start_codon:yes stop_codon:yes gene_type:complete